MSAGRNPRHPSVNTGLGKNDAPWQRELKDGLILRAVRDERDFERYVAAIAAVNGEAESGMADRVLRHHPETRDNDFFLVEDIATEA